MFGPKELQNMNVKCLFERLIRSRKITKRPEEKEGSSDLASPEAATVPVPLTPDTFESATQTQVQYVDRFA